VSRTPPAGVPTHITEDVTGVGRVPFHSDGEAQIYRDVRDLRKSQRAAFERIGRIEVTSARTEGKVDTLLAMQRTKAPSEGGVAKALLADKLKSGAQWRGWALKISAGVILALFGAYIHGWRP
jgi:hypothetical protein